MERTTHLALRSSTFFLTSLKSILYSNKLCQQVEEARQNAAGWARQHRKSMTPTNWQPLERPIDYVVAHDRIPTFRPTRRFLLFWGGTKSNEWKKTRKSSAAGGKSWTSNCVHTVRTSVILTPERSFFRRLNRNEKKKIERPSRRFSPAEQTETSITPQRSRFFSAHWTERRRTKYNSEDSWSILLTLLLLPGLDRRRLSGSQTHRPFRARLCLNEKNCQHHFMLSCQINHQGKQSSHPSFPSTRLASQLLSMHFHRIHRRGWTARQFLLSADPPPSATIRRID